MKICISILLLISTTFLLRAQETTFSLFVVGNTTPNSPQSELLLNKINQLASKTANPSAIIHLGNKKATSSLTDAITNFECFKATSIFVAPGPGEWAGGKSFGKKYIQQLVEQTASQLTFTDAACPGPKEIHLSEKLVLVLLDTQWWLHAFDRRYNKCEIEKDADIIIQLQDVLRRNRGKQIILAAHHNLFSTGNSGGYFSKKQWISQFPVTLYRKLIGANQDMNSPEYRYFKDAFWAILKQFKQTIYLSAGDENLLFDQKDSIYFINSGSFSQSGYTKKKYAIFASQQSGFTRIDFKSDDTFTIQFIGTKETLWKKQFLSPSISKKDIPEKHFPDSVIASASKQYIASNKQTKWLGNNYRQVWQTPIKVPVFDIKKIRGGLSIIKRGGGQQTHSIRMEDKNGKQYVLRSLEKYVEGALPKEIRNTFAIDLAQDFISSSNPYGALAAAKLAEAAGVFHTNPTIVYVPNDPALQQYQKDLANHLFLFEERPAGDRSDEKSFGYSNDLVNTTEVLKKTHKKHSAKVDQKEVLRARLLDLIINDWDRHDDQWRWATHTNKKQTKYHPIPRDRDQAFYKANGILPWLVARKWILPKFQGIDTITHNVEGLSFNARYFDRTFLTSLDWNDWKKIIEQLQTSLTNAEIDKAMQAFPKEIYPICGPQTAALVKARVRNLRPMAHQLYSSISKAVEITGTNKDDKISINNTGKNLLVEIRDKKKKQTIFSRTFNSDETDEVHIYALDGNDQIRFSGNPSKKIRIRIIGGDNKDKIINNSSAVWKQAIVYDKKSTKREGKYPIKLKSNIYKSAVEYDRLRFKYDVTSPGFSFGLNPDDGLILGGGPIIKKYTRFKEWSHRINFNYAFSSNSSHINYEGRVFFPLHRTELTLSANIKSPDYQNNFFGLGNKTKWIVPKKDKNFYRSPVRFYRMKLQFSKFFDKKRKSQLLSTITYKSAEIEKHANRFINFLSSNELKETKHACVSVGYQYNSIATRKLKTEKQFEGSKIFPTKGNRFKVTYNYNIGLKNGSSNFQQLNADWRTYLSFTQRPRVVYAFRVGATKNWGNFPFYYAAQLGGKTNLRGYRATRFHGESAFYQNTDIRIRLGNFRTYVLNGTTGFTLFNDIGRVWLNGENSSKWHHGYGAGFWISPFNFAIFNINLENSREDTLLSFKVNFQF